MKLVDRNLLLYATDTRSPRHAPARAWLEAQLSDEESFAFAWDVLLAYLRLSTNPVVFERPLSSDDAFTIVQRWLAQPYAGVVHPGHRHAAIVRELLRSLGTAGNLVNDAHLAALALEHEAELNSCDTDFSRFAGLRWVNPLDAASVSRPAEHVSVPRRP